MAKRNGGIIGPSNVPNPFIAKGVWKLRDAFNYIKAGLWPVPLGYQIPNSVRFNHASSDELARTNGTATDGKKCTISFWIKKCRIQGSTTTMRFMQAYSGTGNQFHSQWGNGSTSPGDQWDISPGEQGGTEGARITNAAYRDSSAWYHYLWYWDSVAQLSTLYVNGESQSSSTNTAVVLNQITSATKSGTSFRIKSSITGQAEFYLAEFYIIDGQALTPSSFGQTDSATGIWTPKAYTGTYGNNGVYLKFANSAALGTDSSGNGNTFTATNLTSVDQSTDTPTNNFCTFNPLFVQTGNMPTYSEGNLKITGPVAESGVFTIGTIGVSTGKWYYEWKTNQASSTANYAGVTNDTLTSSYEIGDYQLGGMGTSDVCMIAFDASNGKLWIGKNGTWYSNPTTTQAGNPATTATPITTLTGSLFFFEGRSYSSAYSANFNFGSPFYTSGGYTDDGGFGNFSYQPPSGYYSLCTRTLAALG
jgi:hypothetical protein